MLVSRDRLMVLYWILNDIIILVGVVVLLVMVLKVSVFGVVVV